MSLIFAFTLSVFGQLPPDLVPDPRWSPRPGDIASVHNTGPTDAVAADSFSSFEDMIKSGRANDAAGIRELLVDGRLVTLPDRTRVRVIERDQSYAAKGVPYLVVRVEDGRYQDKKLWILQDYVAMMIPRVADRPQPGMDMIPGSNLPRKKSKPVPKAIPPRPVNPAVQAAATLQMGKNLRFQGNRSGAAEYFRKAIKESPGSPAAGEARSILKTMGVN